VRLVVWYGSSIVITLAILRARLSTRDLARAICNDAIDSVYLGPSLMDLARSSKQVKVSIKNYKQVMLFEVSVFLRHV
jgi:hypothetical protein